MTAQQPPQRLDHKLGGRGVGEVGEDDDQRAALEPARQGRQGQGIVGLVRRIVDAADDGLKGAKRVQTTHGAGGHARLGIEGEDARPVARSQAGVGQQQRRMNKAVDARHSADRFAGRPPAVQRHDDIVVSLGAKLLGQQGRVAGRLFPVDGPAIHPGLKVAQGLKLRALADLQLRLGAEQGVAGEQANGLIADPLQVGQDRRRQIEGEGFLLPGQAHRSMPADPQGLQVGCAPPVGREGKGQDSGAIRHRRTARRLVQPQPGVAGQGGLDGLRGRASGVETHCEFGPVGPPDGRAHRPRLVQFQPGARAAAQRVEGDEQQDSCDPDRPGQPARRRQDAGQQGDGNARRHRRHRASGGVDHRGAAT